MPDMNTDHLDCGTCGADLTEEDAIGVYDTEKWFYKGEVRKDPDGRFVAYIDEQEGEFIEPVQDGIPFCKRCGEALDVLKRKPME